MNKHSVIISAFIISLIFSFVSCSNSDDKDIAGPHLNIEEGLGPSSADVLAIPTSLEFLGDSIQQNMLYSLSVNPIKKVTVSAAQSGHIAILGGYKENSAVYIYAKTDDDGIKLTNNEIASLLNKYYNIEYGVSGSEIKAIVTEKNISHGTDYRKLRISIKIFVPGNVSSLATIKDGSIFVHNISGGEHVATSQSGSIRYLNSFGKNFTVHSTSGHIGFINTTAVEYIDVKLSKGNIQLAVPSDTKTTLDLKSSTNITANVLNNTNFAGTNTRTVVKGGLNGGGYKTNAEIGQGTIVFRWYNE